MSYSNNAIDIVNSLSTEATKVASGAKKSYMSVLDLQSGTSFEDILARNKADLLAKNSLNADRDMFSDRALSLEEYMQELEQSSINGLNGEDMLEAFSKYAYGLEDDEKVAENALNIDAMNFLSPYALANQAKISEEEIRFNLAEVEALIKGMRQAGFSDENVFAAMKSAAGNINGVSAEELQAIGLGSIFSKDQALTMREQDDLLTFSKKFAADAEQAKQIASQITSANPSKALDSIANAINANGSMTFSKDEMNALMSALQVSDEQRAQILGLFGDADNIKVDQASFNALFASTKQALAKQEQDLANFAQSISKELTNIENLAKDRMELANSMLSAKNKQTENTRILMEHDLVANVVDSLRNGTLSSATTVDAVLAELSIQNSLNESRVQDSISKLGPQSMADSLKSAMNLSSRSDASNNRNSHEEKQPNKENALAFASAMGSTQANKAGASVQTSASQNAQNVFSQVESSILTAAKKNITSLEVKLNPVELGALNIVLTVKNGEMSALIQPEKIETMNMINKQIDALKAELESQGIKLDNIEVELKSSDDSSMMADNSANQSMGQEGQGRQNQQGFEQLDSQLNDLNRLRTLGRDIQAGTVDMTNVSPEEYELAQNLLNNATVGEELNVFDNYSSVNIMA